MQVSSEQRFIASLQRRGVTHGGPSDDNMSECDSLPRMLAWHAAYMRGDVLFSWSHGGPMQDVTQNHLDLLQEMARCGFISDDGTPEKSETPCTTGDADGRSGEDSDERSGEYFNEITEYLTGFIDNEVLARLDLSAPLVAVVGGRRLVVHGQACELPPALDSHFFIRGATARLPRERLPDRIILVCKDDPYLVAPAGVREQLRATHTFIEFHLYGAAPAPFYDLVAARLRAASARA